MSAGSTAQLILASASPRRRQLLRSIDVDCAVVASEIAEVPWPDEPPVRFAERMATEKALAVAASCRGSWILAADTVVVCNDEILGKPRDAEEARTMLRRLSARAHEVVTGVALVDPGGVLTALFHVTTTVEFRELSATDIDVYVASTEPLDKAGAYAIQGGAAQFVRGINGSHTNVVGLPLDEVRALLERHHIGPVRVPVRESPAK